MAGWQKLPPAFIKLRLALITLNYSTVYSDKLLEKYSDLDEWKDAGCEVPGIRR